MCPESKDGIPTTAEPVLYEVLTGTIPELRKAVAEYRIAGWSLAGGVTYIGVGLYAQAVYPPMS